MRVVAGSLTLAVILLRLAKLVGQKTTTRPKWSRQLPLWFNGNSRRSILMSAGNDLAKQNLCVCVCVCAADFQCPRRNLNWIPTKTLFSAKLWKQWAFVTKFSERFAVATERREIRNFPHFSSKSKNLTHNYSQGYALPAESMTHLDGCYTNWW